MRFSIKWLLAAVAYAAVACASVISASGVWRELVAIAGLIVFVAAAIGALRAHGQIRSFSIGFAMAYVLIRLAAFTSWNAFLDLRNSADGIADRIVSVRQSRSNDFRELLEQELGPNEELGRVFDVQSYSSDIVRVNFSVRSTLFENEQIRSSMFPKAKVKSLVPFDEARLLGKHHLLNTLSLLGGLLGLWFWKREEASQ